jgi:hypothetical protein
MALTDNLPTTGLDDSFAILSGVSSFVLVECDFTESSRVDIVGSRPLRSRDVAKNEVAELVVKTSVSGPLANTL